MNQLKFTTVNANLIKSSVIDLLPYGTIGVQPFDGRILFATEVFFTLTGYTRQELLSPKSTIRYPDLIYCADREITKRESSRQLSDEGRIALECRLIKKDGTFVWVKLYGGFMHDVVEGIYLQYIFLDNILDKSMLEKQAKTQEGRYRIICEQAQDIVFDLDMETGSIYPSPIYQQKFGYRLPPINTVAHLLDSDIIFEADKEKLQELIFLLQQGEAYVEAHCQIKKSTGEYIWCKIKATPIFDDLRKPYRAVGIIADIDHYKKETAILKEKAQKDLLTGLLNKVTTQEHIAAYLHHPLEKKTFHALFLIDIDNFKNINDRLGHLRGDTALMEIAECIRNQCGDNDIIGRIGGDEFIVFIGNTSSKRVIRQKAKNLCTSFRQFFREKKKAFKVSASIGIAICPIDGCTFQELYGKADSALYTAKRKGKDHFSFFSGS